MDTEERTHPAEAGANGQAYYFERRNPMQKYFDNIDDYTDTRPSRLMEFTKRFLPAVIFVASMIVILGTCGALEVM